MSLVVTFDTRRQSQRLSVRWGMPEAPTGDQNDAIDPKRTRQMIRLADGVVFDYVVPIFNMVTSTAKDSNGA
jgi:hypothetical protein